MRETSEKVTLLKRKAIALYNELVLWSQNEIKTKYPHVNAQNQLPHSMDVYQNSSKDPDSTSKQILIYFKDIKKQIKDKNEEDSITKVFFFLMIAPFKLELITQE